jgi:hypothetical protein
MISYRINYLHFKIIKGGANEVDANEVDANEVDANEVDANEVDANEVDGLSEAKGGKRS